ncbi:MAG: helix-turn-helix domain-containing protein [Bacteroidetes bacterium]|nr:helix-turn-helix domain-containing protein [Bacteroidota bacterium]
MALSRTPSNLVNEVAKQNRELLTVVGSIIEYYKKSEGISDYTIASRAGCSRSMIYQLRKGTVGYCGISTITKIAASFNCNLLEWLRSVPPQEQ